MSTVSDLHHELELVGLVPPSETGSFIVCSAEYRMKLETVFERIMYGSEFEALETKKEELEHEVCELEEQIEDFEEKIESLESELASAKRSTEKVEAAR